MELIINNNICKCNNSSSYKYNNLNLDLMRINIIQAINIKIN